MAAAANGAAASLPGNLFLNRREGYEEPCWGGLVHKTVLPGVSEAEGRFGAAGDWGVGANTRKQTGPEH